MVVNSVNLLIFNKQNINKIGERFGILIKNHN